MTKELLKELSMITGGKRIRTNRWLTEYYRSGYRSGRGEAMAVIWPETLPELWKILKVCVQHHAIIVMQAAKTGLTEGSTPSGNDYDREVIVINTLKMKKLILICNGEQIISFPGSTLHSLEQTLKPIGRNPHSVIGSSCIGASIVGGVANNSGGALIKRGPAYTELSLYARVTRSGTLELVNHLGINNLGSEPEEILSNLESGNYSDTDIVDNEKVASDREYAQRVREINEDEPARYNADKRRLFEASGCAGKIAVFAVRLDTFKVSTLEKVFYIGTNDTTLLQRLRRSMLGELEHLPDTAEYMHRDAFNIAEKYGKDVFLLIYHLGTNLLPKMFSVKGLVDAYLNKLPLLPNHMSDKFLQWTSQLWPCHLPKRMLEYRDRYEHHLIIKATDKCVPEIEKFLDTFFSSVEKDRGHYFVCDQIEAKKAYLHRFAAAGSAVRYQIMHHKDVEDIIALDIALRRNDQEWFEKLPDEINQALIASLYYGHFFCHVLHQDYVVRKGVEAKKIKTDMLTLLKERGAKYPAEHNVGHLYEAEPQLAAFYKELDPTNTFNPGIGKTSKRRCCDGL